MKVKALVLTGNGTNCETESAYALRKAGADEVVISTIWNLLAGDISIDQFNFLLLPGGFLDGDNLGSAKAGAHRFAHGIPEKGKPPIIEQLNNLFDNGGLIMGICNGFQLLVKLGLLPWPHQGQNVTLTQNLSGKFEDRWVNLVVDPNSPSIFTKGIDRIDLPIRHGEGRIVYKNDETMNKIEASHLIPLKYCNPSTGEPTEVFPMNPNGSPGGVAALTDPTGRIFGLMPHPEAFTHKTNHPQWTRNQLPEEGMGLKLFRNGVNYLKETKETNVR
jgi:phosphoribosylformylglycinamidine synthase subunit PurQ / glutaminase